MKTKTKVYITVTQVLFWFHCKWTVLTDDMQKLPREKRNKYRRDVPWKTMMSVIETIVA